MHTPTERRYADDTPGATRRRNGKTLTALKYELRQKTSSSERTRLRKFWRKSGLLA